MGKDEVDQCLHCKEDQERELNGYKFANRMLANQVKKQEQISKWLAEKLESYAKDNYKYNSIEWLAKAEQAIDPHSSIVMMSKS